MLISPSVKLQHQNGNDREKARLVEQRTKYNTFTSIYIYTRGKKLTENSDADAAALLNEHLHKPIHQYSWTTQIRGRQCRINMCGPHTPWL